MTQLFIREKRSQSLNLIQALRDEKNCMVCIMGGY